MTLNITFLVQVINFWIAYKILKRFFIQPAFDVIRQEDKARGLLNERLEEVHKNIDELSLHDDRQMKLFQEMCARHIPSLPSFKIRPFVHMADMKEPALSDLQSSKDELCKYLIGVITSDRI